MNQQEFLQTINDYNSIDRKIIKANLKRIMKEQRFRLRDIEGLGYNRYNAASWTNKASNNIPMFEQALTISTTFNFDIKELLK